MKIAFLIVLLGLVAMAAARNIHHDVNDVENINNKDLLKVKSDVETALKEVFLKMTPSELDALLRTSGIMSIITELLNVVKNKVIN